MHHAACGQVGRTQFSGTASYAVPAVQVRSALKMAPKSSKSTLRKAVSSDSICTNVINKEEEVIQEEVTIFKCLTPVLLVILYVYFLFQMYMVLFYTHLLHLLHLLTHSRLVPIVR